MNRNIIIDLFLYFARFPQRQGVLDIFNKGRSEIPGYDSLKSLVESMTDTPVLPEVGGFVFGPNFDAVKTCVSQLTGYYLFVDYGDIKTETDKSNRIADTFQVAATIAGKTTEFTGDLVDQTLISANTLDMVTRMRNLMIQEQRERYSFKKISDKHSITPFISPEFESIGWTLMFDRQAFDLFDAKKMSFSGNRKTDNFGL